MTSDQNIEDRIAGGRFTTTRPLDERILADAFAAMPDPDAAPLATDSAESPVSVDAPRTFSFRRYWNMKTTRRLTLAAAVVLIAAVMTGLLLPQRFNPQQAFAQMVANVRLISTAVVSATITMPDQPQMSMTMYINNRGQMRQEMRLPEPAGTITNVFDFADGKMLTIMPQQKQCMLIDMGQLPPEQLPRNLVDEFRKLPPDAGEWKEKVVEDGRTLLVYDIKQPIAGITLWIDAETLLPVRSHYDMPSPVGQGNIQMVFTDFRWDQPLADDLFSVTPPEGFAVRNMDFNLANLKPEDVVAMLRLWTRLYDGAFPDVVDQTFSFKTQQMMHRIAPPEEMTRESGRKAVADLAHEFLGLDIDPAKPDDLVKAMTQLSVVISRGVMYLGPKFNDDVFVWIGKGAHLGDDRLVCYWPADDGSSYLAINAKLELLTLSRDQLPPAE